MADQLSPARRPRPAYRAPALGRAVHARRHRAAADVPRPPHPPHRAVIGGVGFGFFIDELGKFITEDNNYFYRPAAALIYLIFIGLFLLARAVQRRRPLGPRDELANAVDLLGDAATRDLDEDGAAAGAGPAAPGGPGRSARRAAARRVREHRRAARGAAAATRPPADARARAGSGASWPGAASRRCVSWLFVVWAALSVVGVVELVLAVGFQIERRPSRLRLRPVRRPALRQHREPRLELRVGAPSSPPACIRLRQDRRADAYRLFERALLVAIFFTQVFAFVESQFGAVFGLAVDLVLLAGLRAVAGDASSAARPGSRGARPPAPVRRSR